MATTLRATVALFATVRAASAPASVVTSPQFDEWAETYAEDSLDMGWAAPEQAGELLAPFIEPAVLLGRPGRRCRRPLVPHARACRGGLTAGAVLRSGGGGGLRGLDAGCGSGLMETTWRCASTATVRFWHCGSVPAEAMLNRSGCAYCAVRRWASPTLSGWYTSPQPTAVPLPLGCRQGTPPCP